MSKGIGELQRTIFERVRILERISSGAPVTWPLIRSTLIAMAAKPKTAAEIKNYRLTESYERSAKRALRGLVDRGYLEIVGGNGGPADPFHYQPSRKAAHWLGEKEEATEEQQAN